MSKGKENLSLTDRQIIPRLERSKRREAFLVKFISSANESKSPDKTEKIAAGYSQFLSDLRSISAPYRTRPHLTLGFDPDKLRNLFMDFVHDKSTSTTKKLVLIYSYGLLDGEERSRRQIGQILDLKNSSSLSITQAREAFYDWYLIRGKYG